MPESRGWRKTSQRGCFDEAGAPFADNPELGRFAERIVLGVAQNLAAIDARDRAIVELFYSSGLRLAELVGLDLPELDLADRTVRVLGKGGKQRVEDDARRVTLEHDLLHPVVQDLVRSATCLREGEHMALAYRVCIGCQRESDVLPAAVAEDHREAHHRRRLAAEIDGVGRQVHLPLDPLFCLEAQVRASP
mgnify:CR=1 FL=1